jgi:N-methylhydantoinase B
MSKTAMKAAKKKPAKKVLDAVTLEVIRNALPAIANEMSADLQRTSYNMMIYEVRDFCTSLVDTEGQLISQNVGGVSHFVADLGVIITDAMKRYGAKGFKPGDVIITNHQAVAGQHLNNIVIYMPYFHKGELLMFAMVRAHWIDVGGMSTGFGAGPSVSDPWLEGLQLDQLKIYEAGKVNETLYRVLNIRFPESSLGDMKSQMAACRLAVRRLDELFGKYGKATILQAIAQIFDETERKCRNVVEKLKDGVYEAGWFLDHDGVKRDEPVPIHAKVTIDRGSMTIDLSKCSGERKAGVNSRTYAAARVAYTKAFEEAKALAYRRTANPRVVPLAWVRTAWEEQLDVLGSDPWAYGLADVNRKNLETVLRYCHQQGLIKEMMELDDLFADTDLGDAGGPDNI